MITSELMSEVLGKEVVYMPDNTSFNQDGNQIVYFNKPKGLKFGDTIKTRRINKYEFMHLCKEYCIKNGFTIISGHKPLDEGSSKYSCALGINYSSAVDIFFHSLFECEAVIKATQWVIDNKDKG